MSSSIRQNNHVWATSPRARLRVKPSRSKIATVLRLRHAASTLLGRQVRCNSGAIMHIWYLKSLCLMVIFVRNWIYYKMCSDMKHVAAGSLSPNPFLPPSLTRREKKGIRRRNKQNIWVRGSRVARDLLLAAAKRKVKVWFINWIKGGRDVRVSSHQAGPVAHCALSCSFTVGSNLHLLLFLLRLLLLLFILFFF